MNWLGAVPASTTPAVGAVTDDSPNWFQSWVPAHNWVVVGTLSWVTFCAFALTANARMRVTHSKPRQIDSLRALGCEDCVFEMFLIDIRLSRPEALSFSKRLQWSQLRVPPRGLGIRVCLLMGVLGTHGWQKGATMCQFCLQQRKERRRPENTNQSMDRCQPNLCGAELSLETGVG